MGTADMTAPETILCVKDLRVRFQTLDGTVEAVKGINIKVNAGETVAVVGESGSGKSQTMMAAMSLLSSNGEATGQVDYRGRNLLEMTKSELNKVRGRKISMIFQEPMTSLDPLYTIGNQLMEPIRRHRGLSAPAAREEALKLLRLVHIPDPERRMKSYPHEMSGGQRQRVMIAMALANDPDILIADEPTTALDVTIQAQILDLLRDLRARTGAAIMLITHDLGVVAEIAHRVIVMYAGRIVEEAPVDLLFADPQHPYTLGLLGSIPRLGSDGDERLIAIEGVVPNPYALPPGCRFSPRCPLADAKCRSEAPELREISRGHRTACWKAPLDQALAEATAA